MIFILSLMSNVQIEESAKYIPAIVSQIDNPEFEIRELATNILISIGKLHVDHPKNVTYHYLNHQIQMNLDYEKASPEKKYRIKMILDQIKEKKDVEYTMIDTLRRMYAPKILRN